jgi:hypothetical protein
MPEKWVAQAFVDLIFKQPRGCESAISRHDAPELCKYFALEIRGRRECRVPKAPAARVHW